MHPRTQGLHPLNRLESQNVEAVGQDLSCGVTEKDPGHINFDDLAGLVLLRAVADVIKLRESGGHLVHELAESVEEEIIGDLDNDLGQPKQQLAQLQFLLVVQNDLGRGFGLFDVLERTVECKDLH